MKKLIFLGACLVALVSQPVMAQTGGEDIVVVRVLEYSEHTHLTIERAKQESEEVEFKWETKPGKGERASKDYLDALSKLYQQGYLVQASIPGASSTGSAVLTTLIFFKPNTK
ncbi:MAG: hypothetical protein EOO60_01405 [Hymenobacter sp.]|nr:MAG: hypothetical protein EOO60_01405 [Hymenobacter sp.]